MLLMMSSRDLHHDLAQDRNKRKNTFRKTDISDLRSLSTMTQEAVLSLDAIQDSFEINTVHWDRTPLWKCTLANDKPMMRLKAKA